MNIDIWFLFEQFRSLSVGGKIAVICGHILVILLIVLWDISVAQRHDAKRLQRATPCSIFEPAEKLIHTRGTCSEKGKLCNAHKGLAYLLQAFRNSLSKYRLHHQSKPNGDSALHYLQQTISTHIPTIVNKLRRRVNQSGKEPFCGESYAKIQQGCIW